jgi:hypothetical protein
MFRTRSILSAFVLAAVAGAPLAPAHAQPADKAAEKQAADKQAGNVTLLGDFIHYVLIDQNAGAKASAEELMRRCADPIELVRTVEAAGTDEFARFQNALSRAMRRPDLEAVAGALSKMYEQGKLSLARDPEEIRKNIALLTTTTLGTRIGRDRLVAAGEYAVPQLLHAFLDPSNPSLRAQARGVFLELGRHSVIPLATALPNLQAAQQESVADVLGQLGRRAALPFLADLKDTSPSQSVDQACDRAIQRLGGMGTAEDTADLYYQLAEAYAEENSDLTPFPGEEFQLLWSYMPSQGLVPTGIRTPVFHEAMAMTTAERALTLKPSDRLALTTWIASNFNREIQTPKGYANPAYPADRRDAMYFAVAAGPGISQRVLDRALQARNTPLSRRAIASIEKTAGGVTLWGGDGESSPLLRALTYPNRRVQYESSLALATAQPTRAFSGSERVVPTLAGAVREASDTYAVVIAADVEAYQSVRRTLEKAGFKVLPRGSSLGEVEAQVLEAPAVDLIVSLNLNADRVAGLIDEARGSSKLTATPVLALTDSADYRDLRIRFDRDTSIAVRPAAISEPQLTQAITDLLNISSGGPISDDEARDYSARALAALRDLAISGNQVLNVGDAAGSLIGSLGTTNGPTRLSIADVLSRIDQERAQIALMDAALDASDSEQIALLDKVASSAKRFGNKLESRQVTRLVALTKNAEGQTATSAAALMGALNLPNNDLLPLILSSPSKSTRR